MKFTTEELVEGLHAAAEISAGLRFVGRALQPVHAIVIDRRAGRRVNSAPGISHTLCGADRTDQDVTVTDVRRGARVRCDACSAALVELDVRATRRLSTVRS
jgi:hypothetical protein